MRDFATCPNNQLIADDPNNNPIAMNISTNVDMKEIVVGLVRFWKGASMFSPCKNMDTKIRQNGIHIKPKTIQPRVRM